jgi:hypothetical protein
MMMEPQCQAVTLFCYDLLSFQTCVTSTLLHPTGFRVSGGSRAFSSSSSSSSSRADVQRESLKENRGAKPPQFGIREALSE